MAPRPIRGNALSIGALLLFLVQAGAWQPALADCPNTGGNPNSSCAAEPAAQPASDPAAGAGNPIDVRTGNKYQREVDLAPLPGTLPIDIVRHYNSQSRHVGALGYGWSHGFEAVLYVSKTDIQIRQSDGRRIHFAGQPVGRPFGRQQDPSTAPAATTGTGFHARNPEDGWVIVTRQGHDWHWRTGRVLSFDPHGKLTRIKEPSGHAITLTYDRDGRLFEIADSQSRKLTFGYYANNRIKLIVDPAGESFRYAYDRHGNLEYVTYPDKTKRTYHYEDKHDQHNLTGITDERGIRFATYAYDNHDRAVLSTHANNVNKVTLEYRVGLTILTNSQGNQTRYTLDRNHRLLAAQGPGCSTCGETNVSYRYNPAGQITRITRPATTRTMDYDGQGRLTQVTELAAGTNVGWVSGASRVTHRTDFRLAQSRRLLVRYKYNDTRHSIHPTLVARPSVVPGKEHTLNIAYNDAGQPIEITERGFAPTVDGANPSAIARTTVLRYEEKAGMGRLVAIDGPLPNGPTASPSDSDITSLVYGAEDSAAPASVVSPAGLRSRFRYDAYGRMQSVIDADGVETRYEYDTRGRLAHLTHAGRSAALRYDAAGNLIETGMGRDSAYRARRRLGYDDAGRNTWIASHLGILERFTYDTEDRLIRAGEQSARMNREESFRYDDVGQLVEHVDPNGAVTRVAYDSAGRVTAMTDPLKRLRQYRYDAIGHLAGMTEAANTPYAAAVRFEYDALGRTDSVRAPNGAVTRFVTDDFGRRLATISADAGATRISYDAASRPVARVDATGNRIAYRYDPAGRIIAVTETAGRGNSHKRIAQTRTTEYRYTGNRLTEIIGPGARERYDYDTEGKRSIRTVTLRLEPGAEASYVTRYAYDPATGSLQRETRPDGSIIHYRYNGQDQLVTLDWQRNRFASVVPLATKIERDLVGLKYLRFGNGIEAYFERSKEGTLARIRYRRPESPELREASIIERLFGMSLAQAADAPAHPLPPGEGGPKGRVRAGAPGAITLPPDARALVDHRYLYDAVGNVLLAAEVRQGTNERYAYDPHDRLIQALRESGPATSGARAGVGPLKAANVQASLSLSRYFYDTIGNRLLAQEAVASVTDYADTARLHYRQGTSLVGRSVRPAHDHAPSGAGVTTHYDPAGHPIASGDRDYTYDAFGRLTEATEQDQLIARYRYDHAGRRIAKTVFPLASERSDAGAASAAKVSTTHFLYDGRQLTAELDADGKIIRQYVYLGDQPIAVLDSPGGTPPARIPSNALSAWLRDAAAWLRDSLGDRASVSWLHLNHLGAPELATDEKAKPIWAVRYAPFGTARLTPSPAKSSFTLNLRLPGQYEDAETGLYYNDHRYYDPGAGRYLTPDPLGLRGGINSYAYVANNPLKFIDPSGLILFAFDGTNNGDQRQGVDDWSNVYKFYLAYNEEANGRKWYMNGIGRDDLESGIQTNLLDAGNANTARERVNYMLDQLDQYMESYTPAPDNEVFIDIVGFSRGAAMARDFSNRVAERMLNRQWGAKTACVEVNFMGLWDTVAQFGFNGALNGLWQLDIPAEAQNVFQAVALNEHRALFPGESIGRGIQLGFIGSHADIGGGYGTGDLSDVALNWIYEQAKASGVEMMAWGQNSTNKDWGVVTNPILHDKNTNGGDRKFCLRENNEIIADNCQQQREATPGGMTWSQTGAYISRYTTPTLDADGESPIVGEVRMGDYAQWLKQNYGLDIATAR